MRPVISVLVEGPPYACPVCGTKCLEVKPYAVWPPPEGIDLVPPYEDALGKPSYEVCRTCAFEFGNDDNPGTAPPQFFAQYRVEWERARARK